MKTTIRYIGTRKQRFATAFNDAVDYNPKAVTLLLSLFQSLWTSSKTLHEKRESIRHIHMYGEIVGIQGCPVRAIMRYAILPNSKLHNDA
jgi:hypothetical protein